MSLRFLYNLKLFCIPLKKFLCGRKKCSAGGNNVQQAEKMYRRIEFYTLT